MENTNVRDANEKSLSLLMLQINDLKSKRKDLKRQIKSREYLIKKCLIRAEMNFPLPE